MSGVVILHIFSTFFLTGLIWVIQLVHYPSFRFIDSDNFIAFEKFHTSRISFIVMPLMFTELFSGFYLVFNNISPHLLKYNFTLVLIIWLSTFFLSVPLHSKLSEGKNIQVISKLTLTNWPRTILWSTRTIVILLLLLKGDI